MLAMHTSFWRPLWLRPTVFAAMLAAFMLGYCCRRRRTGAHAAPDTGDPQMTILTGAVVRLTTEEERAFLVATLFTVLTTVGYSGLSRGTAQLDAAEALFAAGVTPEQHERIRSEIRAGLNGERNYEPAHNVRACKLLLAHPAVTL